MYQMYAADPRMRVNVGIRRRLAPLMDNNRDKIELVNFLLMTLPGSPILYYGDEIGMGDNIYLGDRNGVRTPMQWSPDRNAGFSKADPQRLYLPPIMDPIYGYEADQRRGPGTQSLVAAALDQAPDRRAQELQGLRPRQHPIPRTRQPQDPRLCARVGERNDPVRGQSLAHRPAGGTRPRRLQGPGAGRTARAAPPFRRSATCPTC